MATSTMQDKVASHHRSWALGLIAALRASLEANSFSMGKCSLTMLFWASRRWWMEGPRDNYGVGVWLVVGEITPWGVSGVATASGNFRALRLALLSRKPFCLVLPRFFRRMLREIGWIGH